MAGEVGSFLSAVVAPLFDSMGLGAVIAGLAVFIVGWSVFVIVIGRKD